MSLPAAVRLPRFNRLSDVPSIQITQRDQELIRHVFRHRFLRSTHLAALFGGSRQQLLRRLQLLFHHGYLDRPRAQIDYYRPGSQAMVYGVGHRAVALLGEQLGIPRRKVNWTTKNRSVNRYFLEHTLAVADVMVILELACRRHTRFDLLTPAIDGKPIRWQVGVPGTAGLVGVVPDRVFAIRSTSDPNDVRWFFLEADRATMPIERRGSKQTSFAHKLRAYYQTWKQRVLVDSFPRFRVLTVTTTRQRVSHLIDAHQTVNRRKGGGLFLFADRGLLLFSDDPLRQPLFDGRGERVTLLD